MAMGIACHIPDVFSRRAFLRAALSSEVAGLTLPGILHLRARAAEAGIANTDTAVIQIWLGGAASHIETYDPKPDAPAEFRTPWADLSPCWSGAKSSASCSSDT